MKRLFVLPGFLLAFIAVTSCGGSKQTDSAEHEIAALSVDSVLADPDSFVGDTVTVEGVCSHLCKHGGKKSISSRDRRYCASSLRSNGVYGWSISSGIDS